MDIRPSRGSACVLAVLLLLVTGAPVAAAGQATAPAVQYLVAAAAVDPVSGSLGPTTLTIRNGRIDAINGPRPEGAVEIDLGNLTLLPGLIDVHTHLAYDAGEPFGMDDLRVRYGMAPESATAARGIIAARNAVLTLEAGFTTVRDLGTCCFADVTLARMIEAGIVRGPTVVPSASVITVTGGPCAQTLADLRVFDGTPQHGIADTPDEIVEAVRYQILHGARVIKVCLGGSYDEDELRLIVETAGRRGVPVAAHVNDVDAVRVAIAAGVRSIEHIVPLDDELVGEMATAGITFVPTMAVTMLYAGDDSPGPRWLAERLQRERPIYEASLRRALELGMPIAAGSDTGEFGHGGNAAEILALAEAGLTPAEALLAATVAAAELLGFDDRGRLDPGMRADLIAVSGNPLTDLESLRQVRFVMKGGKVEVPLR